MNRELQEHIREKDRIEVEREERLRAATVITEKKEKKSFKYSSSI